MFLQEMDRDNTCALTKGKKKLQFCKLRELHSNDQIMLAAVCLSPWLIILSFWFDMLSIESSVNIPIDCAICMASKLNQIPVR